MVYALVMVHANFSDIGLIKCDHTRPRVMDTQSWHAQNEFLFGACTWEENYWNMSDCGKSNADASRKMIVSDEKTND